METDKVPERFPVAVVFSVPLAVLVVFAESHVCVVGPLVCSVRLLLLLLLLLLSRFSRVRLCATP